MFDPERSKWQNRQHLTTRAPDLLLSSGALKSKFEIPIRADPNNHNQNAIIPKMNILAFWRGTIIFRFGVSYSKLSIILREVISSSVHNASDLLLMIYYYNQIDEVWWSAAVLRNQDRSWNLNHPIDKIISVLDVNILPNDTKNRNSYMWELWQYPMWVWLL